MGDPQLLDLSEAAWEALWSPYDADTYAAALNFLCADDVVLDIGAGDLRFARLAAPRVRRVIAIERNPALVLSQQQSGTRGEGELRILCADALAFPFPRGVTVGVLLMRHCRHFREYAAKLRGVGCRRLITNARWGMGVETVRLDAARVPYRTLRSEWYACECGAAGFVPGPVEVMSDEVVEVDQCPVCGYW